MMHTWLRMSAARSMVRCMTWFAIAHFLLRPLSSQVADQVALRHRKPARRQQQADSNRQGGDDRQRGSDMAQPQMAG